MGDHGCGSNTNHEDAAASLFCFAHIPSPWCLWMDRYLRKNISYLIPLIFLPTCPRLALFLCFYSLLVSLSLPSRPCPLFSIQSLLPSVPPSPRQIIAFLTESLSTHLSPLRLSFSVNQVITSYWATPTTSCSSMRQCDSDLLSLLVNMALAICMVCISYHCDGLTNLQPIILFCLFQLNCITIRACSLGSESTFYSPKKFFEQIEGW